MSATTITRLASEYIAHTGLKEATVSTYAMNDGKRLAKLRTGEVDILSKRAQRVVEWFARNWPEDLEWPSDVPRPDLSGEARGAA